MQEIKYIKDNVNEYKYSDEVNELYLDSMDYKKHKINFKEQYDKSILNKLHFQIHTRYLFISKVIHYENKNTI